MQVVTEKNNDTSLQSLYTGRGKSQSAVQPLKYDAQIEKQGHPQGPCITRHTEWRTQQEVTIRNSKRTNKQGGASTTAPDSMREEPSEKSSPQEKPGEA